MQLSKIRWSVLAINGLSSLLIGCYFIFFSEVLTQIITFFLGGGLILTGFIYIISFYTRKSKIDNKRRLLNLFQGIVQASVGIFIIIKQSNLHDIILYFIALWLVASGISSFVYSIQLRKSINTSVVLTISSSVITLLGISIFLFTESITSQSISFFLGIMIIILGVIVLLYCISVYRVSKKNKRDLTNLVKEEEIYTKVIK